MLKNSVYAVAFVSFDIKEFLAFYSWDLFRDEVGCGRWRMWIKEKSWRKSEKRFPLPPPQKKKKQSEKQSWVSGAELYFI